MVDSAAKLGIFGSGLEVFDFKDTGRGVICKKDFNPGDVLISVPLSLLISKATLQKSLSYSISSLSEIQALVLFILYEFSKQKSGLKTQYSAYLDSLPKEFNSMPLTYPKEIIELLSVPVQKKIRKQRKKMKNDLTIITKLVNENQPEFQFTKSEFAFAWLLVNTRCIHTSKEVVLVPFLDFLNHSSDTSMETEITLNAFNLITSSEFLKGEQAFISYGVHSNTFLFIEYGFVGDYNENTDCVDLTEECFSTLNEKQKGICYSAGLKECLIDSDGANYCMENVLTCGQCTEDDEFESLMGLLYNGESMYDQELVISAYKDAITIVEQAKSKAHYRIMIARQFVAGNKIDKERMESVVKLLEIEHSVLIDAIDPLIAEMRDHYE